MVVTDVNKYSLSKTSPIVLLCVMNRFTRVPTIYINTYCNNQLVMNFFFSCRMLDQQKVLLSLISSRDHFQNLSPLQTSDRPGAGFEPPSLGFVEWSCAVVINATPWHHLSVISKITFFSQTFIILHNMVIQS